MNVNRLVPLLFLAVALPPSPAQAGDMPWVAVSKAKKGFVLDPSGRSFVPWGFNYDHDAEGRLIEDFWDEEWPTVAAHFGQLRKLGANVVRIHLPLSKFMDAPDEANEKAFDRLDKLLRLAEKERLYLDLTGLGCYHKKDVPAWYDKLSEKDRWDVQARFWQAVAGRCKESPAVFCYDLVDHDGKTCGQCHYTMLGAEVAREMIEAGEYEDVANKGAAEHKRRWEKSKFVKLWEKEKKAGRDPRKAFKDRGWEP